MDQRLECSMLRIAGIAVFVSLLVGVHAGRVQAHARLTKSVPCPADAWRRRQARLLIQRICRAVRPLRPSTEVFAEQAGNTRYPNVICLAVAQFT